MDKLVLEYLANQPTPINSAAHTQSTFDSNQKLAQRGNNETRKSFYIVKQIERKRKSLEKVYFNQEHCLPRDYLCEIFFNLFNDSQKQDYSLSSFRKIQRDINGKMRQILVDWLITVYFDLGLTESTLFCTINLINRFISKQPISKEEFQLLGISSLMIAMKIEEIRIPSASIFVGLTDFAFSKEQIFEMEYRILSVLNFDVSIPNEFNLYEVMSLKFMFNDKEYSAGLYYLMMFLLDENSMNFSSKSICEGICYLVGCLSGNQGTKEYFSFGKINSKEAAEMILSFEKKRFFKEKLSCQKVISMILETESIK